MKFMNIELPQQKTISKVRELEIQGIKIGGDSAYSFMSENQNSVKPLFALELPFFYEDTFPPLLKEQYGNDYEITNAVLNAEKLPNDLLSIRFNVREESIEKDFETIKEKLPAIFSSTKKPLILRGRNNNEIDIKLLPLLAENAPKQSIISFIEDTSYEQILPSVIKNNHYVIIRTPIDINLAKEMNILTADKGLDLNKIIIDPDMGGLGYGLDYGYSVIEKIKQAGFGGDTMLNMPVIGFIGEECFKAKESKADSYDKNWGEYGKRAAMWEIAGASAIAAAGANIIVLWSETALKTLKGVF